MDGRGRTGKSVTAIHESEVKNIHACRCGEIVKWSWKRCRRLNGLVVWFSLWVREAPGSNPGWALLLDIIKNVEDDEHDNQTLIWWSTRLVNRKLSIEKVDVGGKSESDSARACQSRFSCFKRRIVVQATSCSTYSVRARVVRCGHARTQGEWMVEGERVRVWRQFTRAKWRIFTLVDAEKL